MTNNPYVCSSFLTAGDLVGSGTDALRHCSRVTLLTGGSSAPVRLHVRGPLWKHGYEPSECSCTMPLL